MRRSIKDTQANRLPGPMVHKHTIICTDSHSKIVKHTNRKSNNNNNDKDRKPEKRLLQNLNLLTAGTSSLTDMRAHAANTHAHTHPTYIHVLYWYLLVSLLSLVLLWFFPGPSNEMASAGSRGRLETTNLQP